MKTINIAGANMNAGLSAGGSSSTISAKNVKATSKNNKSLFAGNQNRSEERVEQKRSQAKKQARKIIGDQFAKHSAITDDIKDRATNIESLQEENKILDEELRYYKEKYEVAKKALQELEAPDPNSQELDDLNLLLKANDAMREGTYNEDITPEEQERIANMGERTEYQNHVLRVDDIGARARHYQKLIGENNQMIQMESGAIKGAKEGLLKDHSAWDAQIAAEEILEAASKDIISMLIEDAKEFIDEDIEETVKEAEEAAEKKKEEEEKLEKDQEQGEVVTESQDNSISQNQIQKELKKVMKELEELDDVKGIMVDGKV